MAISPKNRARALELAKELNELNGGRYHEDGTPKTFDELEIETNALTDLLSSMALNESARDLPEEEKPVRCPQCKAAPKPHDPDDDEPMVIQSARGEVEWINQGFYCRRCRRSFFLRLAELALRVEATVSPKVERKMVYAGANQASYQVASDDLRELAELNIKTERIRLATLRNGKARRELEKTLREAFLEKSIPDQNHSGPADKEAPELAVVMSDGGRYQRFDRDGKKPESGSFWKESRMAILLSMKAKSHQEDPNSELPDFLKDVCIAKKLAEMGSVAGENPKGQRGDVPQESPWQRPDLLSKEVVASGQSWKEFGPMAASSAWHAGFFKAKHRVFVSDGSSAIEEMQQQWFGNFTSVLDIMHALSYSLAAALAIHPEQADSWACYCRFAKFIWQRKVDEVIAELDQHQAKMGDPPTDASDTDAREVVRRSCVYYRNHRGRMNYPEYRRRGYPLTSSIMESTVKQVNRRVKGSEKFWSTAGVEAVLGLRSAYISDSKPMEDYWKHTQQATNGCRAYLAA